MADIVVMSTCAEGLDAVRRLIPIVADELAALPPGVDLDARLYRHHGRAMLNRLALSEGLRWSETVRTVKLSLAGLQVSAPGPIAALRRWLAVAEGA